MSTFPTIMRKSVGSCPLASRVIHRDLGQDLGQHRVRGRKDRITISRGLEPRSYPERPTPSSVCKTSAALRHSWHGYMSVSSREFKRHLAAAGLPDSLRFYDMRHAAATLLIANGLPITVVSAMLGHALTSTTLNNYAYVMPGSDRLTSEAMERLLGQACGVLFIAVGDAGRIGRDIQPSWMLYWLE